MQNRNQKPIRRVDVRQLKKLAFLDVKKRYKNEVPAGKTGAAPRSPAPVAGCETTSSLRSPGLQASTRAAAG